MEQNELETTLTQLRLKKPLILNITNVVTMDFVANSLLALGATPMMSLCDDELVELVQISNAININIGTLDHAFIKRCKLTSEIARQHHTPLILDPVGAGASKIRTKTALNLLPYACIVRGNASEILALSGSQLKTRGVDTANTVSEAKRAAFELAQQYGSTIVVSGAIDFITNGIHEIELTHGSSLMPLITGMGCALTAVIAAFKAIVEDPFQASVLAADYFGHCGELTALTCAHPGSFKHIFIDNLHTIKGH